jgi:ABC-2 type transport system permease protein
MDKVRRVAIGEFLNAVRSKAFVMSLLALPIMAGLAVGLQIYAGKKVDMTPRKFAVVDRTGKLFEVIKTEAGERNARLGEVPAALEGLKSVLPPQPHFTPVQFDPEDRDATALELELSQRVRKKELFAFVIVGPEVFDPDAQTNQVVQYFTLTPTFNELPSWIQRTINDELRRVRLEGAGLDGGLIRKLSRGVEFDRRGLARKTSDGKVEKAKKEDKVKTILVPMVSMLLLFMIVMTSAPMLMNSVLEEKMNKVAEVLVSAVSPFELMMGKLIGCVMVSGTLSFFYLGSIYGFLAKSGLLSYVPWDLVGWFFVFQVMALFIFGSIFLAIGSACSEIRDAQSLMFPAMILVIVPMLVWLPIVQSPHSPFAVVMSLIPPFTPTLMMLRLATPAGVSWWELSLALVLTGGFMVFCVWAASKIFRVGILAQGQAPSLVRLLSWIASK